MPFLDQLPNVATGTPRRRAASCPPTDAASLIASALNSCVYCLLGSLSSFISILRTFEVSNFLLYVKSRQGHLVCDDFSGYKALFELGVTEVGCMAHARRKFVELHAANKSSIAGTALELFGQLYQVERDIQALADATQRLRHRRTRAGPIAKALHDWMMAQRGRVPPGTATAKALDYSLNRWAALTRYLDDARLPIDNNHDEQQIRPWATGRKNWLFAGTLAAGQRAAAITSLIQSAKLNGHDPYVYLKDVLERLPTQRASDIDQLLPHRWTPVT